MMGAATLTLGVLHLLVWLRARANRARLVFFVAAASVAALSIIELASFQALRPAAYAEAVRWGQLWVAVLAFALVAFVHTYVGGGRRWLGGLAIAMRLATLPANFLAEGNLNFQRVDSLRHIEWLGAGPIAVPVGPANPWVALAALANLMLLAYVVDVLVRAWRGGDPLRRRRAIVVCGSIIVFVSIATAVAMSISKGLLVFPLTASLWFTVIVLAMGYELSLDLFRAEQLAGRLHSSEAQARDAEQRMQLAVAAAAVGPWSWDIAHDRVWTTARARELFGVDAAVPLRLSGLLDCVHVEDRERVRTGIAATQVGAADLALECRIPNPDGTPRWIALTGRAGRGALDAAPVLHGVALDVSARRRLEREAAQQRDELAHLSRVSLLGELSGSLAHELNQPLMAIMGNAQAALRFMDQDPVDLAELRGILGDIVDNDRRAGEIIRRLRAMLRKEPADHRPLELNAVVREVLAIVHSDLIARDVAVELQLHPRLPPVPGDRIQVQQVVLNLLMNACDALPEASGDRRIVIETALAGVADVVLRVVDRGAGIPAGDLERVFEPFVTTKATGMGLGLAVCRTIVAAHGGRVWATSHVDRGTTFHVTLPAAQSAR